jgi:short-subunit dehydrogenase
MRLTGVTAVVTGGSSGIGLATAAQLADRGARVTVVGSDPTRVQAAADAVRGIPVVCDFADAAAVLALAGSLADGSASGGTVPDLVIHNAGVGLRAPASEANAAELARIFAINVIAPITLTAAMVPAMVRRGSGRLAFVGSIAGAVGAAGESVYAATKSALTGYADSLRTELAGTGVGVTVLLPGVVATDFFDRRGVPYHRTNPKPITAERVARGFLRGIERDANRVTVPGWLRLPIALGAVTPQLYGRLAGRFGR